MTTKAEQDQRLLTVLFDQSPVTKVTWWLAKRCYRLAEVLAGISPDEAEADPDPRLGNWPRRARFIDLIGEKADNLGTWANGRRAVRTLRRENRSTP